jgi:hypothetical protein
MLFPTQIDKGIMVRPLLPMPPSPIEPSYAVSRLMITLIGVSLSQRRAYETHFSCAPRRNIIKEFSGLRRTLSDAQFVSATPSASYLPWTQRPSPGWRVHLLTRSNVCAALFGHHEPRRLHVASEG